MKEGVWFTDEAFCRNCRHWRKSQDVKFYGRCKVMPKKGPMHMDNGCGYFCKQSVYEEMRAEVVEEVKRDVMRYLDSNMHKIVVDEMNDALKTVRNMIGKKEQGSDEDELILED